MCQHCGKDLSILNLYPIGWMGVDLLICKSCCKKFKIRLKSDSQSKQIKPLVYSNNKQTELPMW